jgi:hypothetical protein
MIDDNDIDEFKRLLNKFNLLDSQQTSKNFNSDNYLDKINTLRPRFKETEGISKMDSEEMEFNFNFDNSKLENKKDKEIQRREGLSNGHILYNKRRTVNIETNEYADLYYDLNS